MRTNNKSGNTRNSIGGRTEMAEECEHLRRHTGDQSDQASGDDDDDEDDDDDDDEEDVNETVRHY